MEIVYIAALSFLSALVGTVSGFGISTIMLPVLVLFFSFTESLLFAGILHAFDDVWKIILFRKHMRWKVIFEFGVPAVLAAVIGANLALDIPQEAANMVLGVFFAGYVVFLLVHPHFEIKHQAWTASVGGALSGFSAGVLGLGGAIRAAFLSAFNLRKEVYLSTIGVIAVFTDIGRVVTYVAGDASIKGVLLWGLPIFIGVSFVGAKIAQKIVHKIPQDKFRMVIAGFLFIMAIKLIFF